MDTKDGIREGNIKELQRGIIAASGQKAFWETNQTDGFAGMNPKAEAARCKAEIEAGERLLKEYLNIK